MHADHLHIIAHAQCYIFYSAAPPSGEVINYKTRSALYRAARWLGYELHQHKIKCKQSFYIFSQVLTSRRVSSRHVTSRHCCYLRKPSITAEQPIATCHSCLIKITNPICIHEFTKLLAAVQRKYLELV